ncbi:MAG: hypothetical protein V4562_08705 [Pseudomonadota bacterium]
MIAVVDAVQTRVVATLHGSLPMGGFVANAPIHALTAPLPAFDDAMQPAERTDIDLGGPLAFGIDNIISEAEADRIIALTEQMGYRPEAPGIQTAPGMRMNKSVHWVADAALIQRIFARIGPLLPPQIDGDTLHPQLSQRLNMYRYDDNDVFNRHTDGDWPGFGLSADGTQMVEWPGLRSKLTMLLYLNGPEQGVLGGNTRLFRPDGGAVDVTPRKGAALFFRHGFGRGSVLHEGARVLGEVPKYVARINVLYTQQG